MQDNTPRLLMEAKNIFKVFPGTTALQDVDFRIYGGKINVLVGENGAGKSTLMKIIAGIEQPSDGKLIMYNEAGETEEISFSSTREAVRKRIGIVHQELNLFADLSVSENIFMNKEIQKYSSLYIDHEAQKKRAKTILKKLGQDINPDTLVRDLRLGQQQIVEIAKTMIDDPMILIMDEPTSSLSMPEVKVLFRVIKELKEQGVAIVYISHRLEEVKEIGDYITILRDSHLIHSGFIKEIDMSDIISNMVGRDPKQFFSGQAHVTGKELLRVKDMVLRRFGGGYTLDHVSFSVKEGEILGIYGLMGAGRTELLESLMGIYDKAEGEIWLEDKCLDKKNTKERIESGLVLIPEERQREGLFLNLAVNANLTMASLKQYVKGFHIKSKLENGQIREMIRKMAIK
ncbi:MAG: sugar ABC transporter ATP-binding protein, partial [Spirochaetia bacterium]|nr:sugar ABC transporter ATP-binding protein [Spirochaetia bacterium]